MSNIYIDAGFYMGMTLQRYIDAGIIDKTWRIIAFEPNPDLTSEKKIEDFFGDYDIELIRKAVWIEDGKVTFDIGGREDSGCIEGTAGHPDPKKITVPSIDFSKFVSEVAPYGKTVRIIISMNIEGAEFKVLEKMLADDTIDNIAELDIEFHHRLMLDYTDKHARKLIKQIKKRGVEVTLKEALN